MRDYCDGINRRDALRVGAGAFGLTLESLLRRQAAATEKGIDNRRDDVSLIVLFLKGGLSTIDTLDMKPHAPSEFRGEFDPIATNVPGIEVCNHLPHLSRVADKFALLRSFTHTDSNHGPADHWMLTGYAPRAGFNPSLKPNNQFPSLGSIVAKSLGPRGSVPPYVCLPRMHSSCGPAYLGPTAAPFVVEADPNAPDFSVPDLLPPLTVDAGRLGSRRDLLQTVDRFARSEEAKANAAANTTRTFREKAFSLMASPQTKAAFDIGLEPDKLRDEYGRHSLGQSLLMSRRLVEAGVRCVTIDHTNWDTHYDNFNTLKNDLLPHLDSGLSALLRDLHDRSLNQKTLVVVMGEFGRTPRVNKDAGRDHWGPSNCILLSGGGVRGGLVLGETNAHGEKPVGDTTGPADLAATICHCLGINPDNEFHTPEGRPVKITNSGRVIRGLLG
ncbi:MAG: DUF1501 domain-containing protein [Planctomycetales bacterium]|nr:DUF1501 domain-containing protein [Planctomycetales bacterium]